jgi:hypothetical protein
LGQQAMTVVKHLALLLAMELLQLPARLRLI